MGFNRLFDNKEAEHTKNLYCNGIFIDFNGNIRKLTVDEIHTNALINFDEIFRSK